MPDTVEQGGMPVRIEEREFSGMIEEGRGNSQH